ncbi:MAG TPA: serine hydrolase, partial [Anaerolinea sp.]|nr:serine hydrolase [Anaerolinea sp.]
QRGEGFLSGGVDPYNGMLVVRRRDYAGQTEVEAALNRVLNRGGRWQVLVKPVGGEPVFSRDAGQVIHPASVIKVPLGMLVMKELMTHSEDLDAALAGAPPQAGRTYTQLLRAMLVLSEETATDILEKDLLTRMGEAKIRETLKEWGAPNTTLEPRRSTALEIAALWQGLYTRRMLGDQASAILLDYLAEKTDGDAVRLWRLASVLPEGSVIYNKRGSLTSPMIVADSGIIVLPGGEAYILCVFGEPDDWTGFEGLDAGIGDFAVTWYQETLPGALSR